MEILTTKEDYWKARAEEAEALLRELANADYGCGCCSDDFPSDALARARKLVDPCS